MQQPGDTIRIGDREFVILGVTSPDDLGARRFYLSLPSGVARCVANAHGYVTSPRFEGKPHWWEDYREMLCRESIPHPSTRLEDQ